MKEKIKKLYRDERHEVIGGVCAGLGEYFHIDPVLIRAIFVIFGLMGGFAVLLYIVLWIIIPAKKY
ncbi:MAG: PspC domain-containing protein [Candidatus Absconditicoccaceae bacterium]